MEEKPEPIGKLNKCAVFGGSFDPVHLGHLGMAAKAKESLALDRVIFLPCAVSPFKTGTVASALQRRDMLSRALADSEMDWAGISDFELNRPAPSYSWEAARYFTDEAPDVEWYWIVGTDQWQMIDRWARPEILRELLHFIVFTRDGDNVEPRPGWKFTAVPFHHPASSSAIRNDFPAHSDWLSAGVKEYASSQGIY
jgi:nicotinate-nucleotide adenylyltransferase